MTDYLQHAVELPDGSFVKIAQQLPDGSYAVIARPDDGSCVPCGCDGVPCSPAPSCVELDLRGVVVNRDCVLPDGRRLTIRAGGINRVFRVPIESEQFKTYRSVFPASYHSFIEGDDGPVESTCVSVFVQLVCSDDLPNNPIENQLVVSQVVVAIPVAGGIAIFQVPQSTQPRPGLPSAFNNINLGACFPNGGAGVVSAQGSCVALPSIMYADHCGGTLERITVDLATRPGGICDSTDAGGLPLLNVRYLNEIYTLGDESNQETVPVEWVSDSCDPPGNLWPVASECGNPGNTITFDPANRPTDGVAFIVSGRRYLPNGDDAARLPSVGVWSPDSCPTIINCGDILDPSDPLCDTLEYQHCPQCQRQGERDPIIEPNTLQSNVDPRQQAAINDFLKKQLGCVGCGG